MKKILIFLLLVSQLCFGQDAVTRVLSGSGGGSGGGSQTLQQTIDVGNVLTKSDTVDLNNFSLVFFDGNIGVGALPGGLFRVARGSNSFLRVDPDADLYEFGDMNGLGNSSYYSMNDNTQITELRSMTRIDLTTALLKWNSDTIATRAYARSVGGGGVDTTSLSARINAKADKDLSNLDQISVISTLLFHSAVSGSTPTPTPYGNSRWNYYTLTGLSSNAVFAAPTGTPLHNNLLWVIIGDNGTSRTTDWNAIYDTGSDIALPTATIAGEEMELQFRYHEPTTKWRLVGRIGGFMIVGEAGQLIQMVSDELATRIINLKHRYQKAG